MDVPNPPAVTLRQFTSADLPAVRWLHDRTPAAGQVASRPMAWPDALDRIPDLFVGFWLAFEHSNGEQHLVGMAGLEEVRAGAARPPVPHFVDTSRRLARIEYVRVAPERQRRGLGRMLTGAAIDAARERGYEAVVLDTTSSQEAAVQLYLSLGFLERGRTLHGRWEVVWFELPLANVRTPAG